MSNRSKRFSLTGRRPSRQVRHLVALSATAGLSLATGGVAMIGGPLVSAAQAAALPPECVQSASMVTCNYLPTGAEQQFAVPAGVTSLQVAAVGGAGQSSAYLLSTTSGGLGALVTANLPVTPGQSLYVEVAGAGNGTAGGFNGGGNGSANGQGGGGASDVRACSMAADSCPDGGLTLDSRLLVAAGGGGAGGGGDAIGGAGGSAGASPQPGTPGANSPSTFGGGGGGAASASAGGTGGIGAADLAGAPGYAGASGGQGTGGAGAHDLGSGNNDPQGLTGGGGGGGGWFGGGGAGSGSDHYIFVAQGFRLVPGAGGGGGAGSSYVDPAADNASITTGPSAGAASVSITYTLPVAALPSAPSIGAAIAGDGSATISFSAPTFDGNSPITGYVATATPVDGGTPITGPATAAPFTMTGLTNRTTYTVTVAAINSVGTGPASASSNSFMPVAPMEITTPSQLPNFPINKPMSMVLNATGGTGLFSWSVLPGDSLPVGLTLGTDGTIYGTPTTAVTDQVFSVRVVDGSGEAAIKAMIESIVVTGTPPAVTGTPSTASVGEGYRYAFTRTGNPLPVVGKSSGALPDGLTLSSAGVLSGTPTRAGTFTFVLSASNGVVPAATLRVTLVVRPLPTVSVADISVTEGNSGWKAMTFTARLSRASTVPVTVFWQSSNGTATNALDFSSGSGTLTFPAGTTARTFTVWVHGDRTREATEYFWVHLSSPSHVTLGRTWAKGTIVNDD